jgi:hypothetical protein
MKESNPTVNSRVTMIADAHSHHWRDSTCLSSAKARRGSPASITSDGLFGLVSGAWNSAITPYSRVGRIRRTMVRLLVLHIVPNLTMRRDMRSGPQPRASSSWRRRERIAELARSKFYVGRERSRADNFKTEIEWRECRCDCWCGSAWWRSGTRRRR